VIESGENPVILSNPNPITEADRAGRGLFR
jgi:hypothetical protein